MKKTRSTGGGSHRTLAPVSTWRKGRAIYIKHTRRQLYEDANLVAYSMSSGQRKTVLHGGYFGRYVPTGHLVYMHDGTLFVVAFDLKRLEVTGSPMPLLDGITASPGDASAQFSLSDNGTLIYVPGHSGFQFASIYWMDRQGKFTPIRKTPADYYMPAFSPEPKAC
jgi:hypothetical protein